MPYADPDTARDYQREYRRLSRAGACTSPRTTRLPSEFRLRTARDVMKLLEQQIEAVRNDAEAGTLEKARTIGYLAGISLRAVEAGDMVSRLEALELTLKTRGDAS